MFTRVKPIKATHALKVQPFSQPSFNSVIWNWNTRTQQSFMVYLICRCSNAIKPWHSARLFLKILLSRKDSDKEGWQPRPWRGNHSWQQVVNVRSCQLSPQKITIAYWMNFAVFWKNPLSTKAIFGCCTIYMLNVVQVRGACCNKDSSIWL